MNKIVAALAVVAGSLGSIFELLVAFGVHLTANQQTAIASVCGVALAILGVFFHPAVNAKFNPPAPAPKA